MLLQAHVEEILVERSMAVGVRLRGKGKKAGIVITANKAVVSNASIWDTQKLL